eukprot:7465098-Alexandrium_andersonii.AAC.1
MQGLPTKHLAGSDAVRKDVEDRGSLVALVSYVKVAADQATTLEAASGPNSTFLRTIAQHREAEVQVPIKWIPRKPEEEGPAYLARCL